MNTKLDEFISKLMHIQKEQTNLAVRQQGQLNAIMVILFSLTSILTDKAPQLRESMAERIKLLSVQMKKEQRPQNIPLYDEILGFFLQHIEDNPDTDPLLEKAPWLRGVIQGGRTEEDRGDIP